MGWRDRAKKSFAYSAYSAEGVQKLKEKKRGLKTTLEYPTQITQNTQNRNKHKKNRSVKKETNKQKPAPTGEEVFNILSAAEEVNLKNSNKSEVLETAAKILENPKVKLKKQERKKAVRMGKELNPALKVISKDMRAHAIRDAAWITSLTENSHIIGSGDFLDIIETEDLPDEDYCPAKDKKTYLCYGQTYFTGKATKHPRRQCDPMLCEYQLQLAEYHERQAEGFNHAAH